ncbi:hypothetical protein D3C80_1560920 [compost metagenome]
MARWRNAFLPDGNKHVLGRWGDATLPAGVMGSDSVRHHRQRDANLSERHGRYRDRGGCGCCGETGNAGNGQALYTRRDFDWRGRAVLFPATCAFTSIRIADPDWYFGRFLYRAAQCVTAGARQAYCWRRQRDCRPEFG